MTDERKNEIWDYLPNDIRCKLQRDYIKACEAQELDPRNDRIYAHRMVMQKYFSKDNLESYNELNEAYLTAPAEEKCANSTENGISDLKIQSESAESVETSTKEGAYFVYRLDLAKELAVAMINNPNSYGNIAMTSVDTTNEIVKRLKETEI